MSWLVGEFFISILAISGGALAFRGLWIEKKADEAEKKEHLDAFVDEVKSLKLKSKYGWKMLMWGIFIETVVAGVFAAKDGWEIRQMKINELNNDWRKQPIYAFEATARLLVRPLEPIENFEKLPQVPFFPTIPFGFSSAQTPEKESNLIFLNLGRSVDMAKGAYSRENAEIQDDEAYKYMAFEINGTNRFLRFDIHFGGHHENFFENKAGNTWEFFNDSLTPEDLDAIDLVLPIRCEIISGEVKMSIDNGLTNRVFEIPKQTTFVCAATSVATNGTFVPIDFSPEIRAEVEKSKLK
jgi:hypothetical protein